MRGIDTEAPRRYIVIDEQKVRTEEQTVFLLKNLSIREMEQLRNCMFASETAVKKKKRQSRERYFLGTQERLSLEIGILGWENFRDARGKDIPFNKENIDKIPLEYRSELALEIRRENDDEEEEEEKNFGSEHQSINSKTLPGTDVPTISST